MKQEEKNAKMNEAVSQIGRLITVCAENGLDQGDVSIMLQSSTSLFCEMNELPMKDYLMFLYVLHQARLEPGYDGSDPAVVRAELRKLFTGEGEAREFMI